MSYTSEKDYYRQYMRKYYKNHKDYWKNYYLNRKQTNKRSIKGAYRSRKHYMTKINTAWYQEHVERNPLSRLFRRLGTTASYLEPIRRNPPDRKDKTVEKKKSAIQLRRIIEDTLRREGFTNIQLPTQESENLSVSSGFQILAIKDNRKCIVEAVTSPFKILSKIKKEYLKLFLKFFDARYFLCFIRPDSSRYHLVELDPSNIRSVTLGLKAISEMKAIPIIT